MTDQFRKFDKESDNETYAVQARIMKEYAKQVEEHHRDLTPKEQQAISTYCGTGYGPINNYLRRTGSIPKVGGRSTSSILKNLLDRKFLPENLILYRGRSGKSGKIFKGTFEEFIEEPSFVSTSLNKFVALGFTGWATKIKELCEIQVPAGTRGFLVSYKGECEVILPPNSRFQILRKIPDLSIKHYSSFVKVTKLELKLIP